VADHGPYETARDAHAAAVAAFPGEAGTILTAEQNRQLLGRALEAASVPVGRYGDQLIEWLAGLEDAMCAEIARWVTAAAQLPEGTVTEWSVTPNAPIGVSEDAARAAAEYARTRGRSTPLYSRQVTPWTEAPGTAEDEDDAT
jgi:hypothetical protein